MVLSSLINVAAMIAYILSLEITGCISLPTSQESTEEVCHKDFDYQQILPKCSGQPISIRYSYDSASSTCSLAYTCSLGYSMTHSTMEECTNACSQDTKEKTCSLPKLSNGNAHTINCGGKDQCSVYYSCDQGYELYPEESRIKKFQCNNGTWEDHTAYCAKLEMQVHVDGVKIDEETSHITVDSGKEVKLSCEVIGDVIPDEYNMTWIFKDHYQETEIIGSDNEVILSSVNETHGGTYICSVSGSINQEIEKELRIVILATEAPAGPPTIDAFYAMPRGNSLIGFCLCKGLPKPSSKWIVGDQTYINDLAPNSEYTLNVLNVTHAIGKYNVSCECENIHGSVSRRVELDTTERKRRSISEITSAKLNKFCELNDKAAIVTGKVLRQTRSTVHLKVERVLMEHSRHSGIGENDIIRVQSTQKLERNQKYTMKLTKKSSEHLLVDTLPYGQGMDSVLSSYCR